MAGKTAKQLLAEVEAKKKKAAKLKLDAKALDGQVASLKKLAAEAKKMEALAKPKAKAKSKAKAKAKAKK